MSHHGSDTAATRDKNPKVAEAVAFDANKTLKIIDAGNFSRSRKVQFAV
jgi:hypothetical protein